MVCAAGKILNLDILDSRLTQNIPSNSMVCKTVYSKKIQVSSISTLVVMIYFPCSRGSFIAYLL